MTLTVRTDESLGRFVSTLGPAGRRHLMSAAAEGLHALTVNHLRRIAPARHATAARLGGVRTGHLEKGIGGASFTYTADTASVVLPIAGLNRAFGEVTVTPKRAGALTLPVHGAAYGHRVAELRRMGWDVFRPKGRDVLMGRRKGEREAVTLYALKRRATLRQDRALLPGDAEIRATATRLMLAEIERIAG